MAKKVKKTKSKKNNDKSSKDKEALIKKAREQIVERLIKEKGMSKEEAEKIADKLISEKLPTETPTLKILEQFLDKKDAKAVDQYVAAVVGKFGKYIKSIVLWGSTKTKKTLSKKKKIHDIDIAIIVDDTDVRRMTRPELKDKLFQRLLEMGYPISKKIHPQPYLLTEFWQYVLEGNPVLYNVLRDGVILYDTGFFLPVQMLMKMGNIKPSKEAIDKHIYVANELLKLAENTMLTKLSYDLEQAIVSSAQAVLMELGYRPPTPSETPKFVRDKLVKENKLVPEKYAKIAETIVKNYKDIEHKDKKVYTGKEWDKHLEMTKDFVKKMTEVLKKIRKEKGETFLYEAVEKKKNLKVKRPTDIELDRGEKPLEKADEIIKKELGQR
ncbi:MAG: hypothetical protein J7K73_02465 [Nanoarchaeota archaeon]|nr:hypothetical protein [Nanoarchaeota archaeon]